jgi:hypothetical protein
MGEGNGIEVRGLDRRTWAIASAQEHLAKNKRERGRQNIRKWCQ